MASVIIVVVELVFLAGTILHVSYFNGSPYWEWSWRHLSYLRTTSYLLPPLIPFVYALYRIQKIKETREASRILVLLMVSNFLFQLAGMAAESGSLEPVKSIIVSRRATSYFYDAEQIKNIFSFLQSFHALDLRGHSSVHPPGPIIFHYAMIQFFGVDGGAYMGGLTIAWMASLGIAVLYLLSSLWTGDGKVRLTICACYALIPGLVLFFPQFDQVHPIFSMLLIYFWEIALRKSRRHAVYFGLVLFMATLFAYNLLVIGAFPLFSAIAFLLRGQAAVDKWRIVVSASLLAVGTTAFCYLGLFWATGFNPLFSLQRALNENASILAVVQRPYGFYVVYNFYEFFLGSGIITIPLLAFYVQRTLGGARQSVEDHVVLSHLGFLTIIAVDLTGLLRSEATRIWLFLQPLIVIPVGLELMRLSAAHRQAVLLMLWINLVVIKSNMRFIIP